MATFRASEVMLHRFEIQSETTNFIEMNIDKIGGSIKTHEVIMRRITRPGDISGHFSLYI